MASFVPTGSTLQRSSGSVGEYIDCTMVRTYQDCLERGQNSVDKMGEPDPASGRIRLEKT